MAVKEDVLSIDSLPTEILLSIFLVLVEQWHLDSWTSRSSTHPFGAVGVVCRRWYDAAHGFPELWSHIEVNHASQLALEASLTLAKDASLRLFSSQSSTKIPFMKMFLPHLHRTTSLELRSSPKYLPFLQPDFHNYETLDRIAPRLETLKVEVVANPPSEPNEEILSSQEWAEQFAALQAGIRTLLETYEGGLKYLSLALAGGAIPFICLPAGLRELQLSNYIHDPFCPTMDLLTLLKSTPHLRSLHLSGNYIGNPSSQSLDVPVVLPNLEELVLNTAPLSAIGIVLEALEYPPLTRLTVEPGDFVGFVDAGLKGFETLCDTVEWLCQDIELAVTDSLSISLRTSFLTVEWQRIWPEGNGIGPIIHLVIPFKYGYAEQSGLIPKICRAFAAESLRDLNVSTDGRLLELDGWTETFGGSAHGQAGALSSINIRAQELIPFITALTAVDHKLDFTSGKKSKVPLFPALRSLTLRNVDFVRLSPSTAFLQMLEHRSILGVRIEQLRLVDCLGFYYGQHLERCKKAVGKIEVVLSQSIDTRPMIRRKN